MSPGGVSPARPQSLQLAALGHDRASGASAALPARPVTAIRGVDEHPRREEIRRLITVQPGLSIEEVARAVGLSRGATRHHLATLERVGATVSAQQGNRRLHFAAAMPPLRRDAVMMLRLPSVRSIVAATVQQPQGRCTDLAGATGLSSRSIRRGLRSLEKMGLASCRAKKRGYYDIRYHPDLRLAWVHHCQGALTTLQQPRWRAPAWLLVGIMSLGRIFNGPWIGGDPE